MKLFAFKTSDKVQHFINAEQITELIVTGDNKTIIRLNCGKELITALSTTQIITALDSIFGYSVNNQPLSEEF